MRNLKRNKQTVWFANYVSEKEIIDEYGNSTGSYEIEYSKPQKAKWNVGVVESDAEVEMFGIQAVDVIRVLPEKKGFSLSGASIIWYGIEPAIKPDGTTNTPHNYGSIKIRKTLNELVFYAQRVDVS